MTKQQQQQLPIFFFSTLEAASKLLVSVASSIEAPHKWTAFLHLLRFILMLLTWISLWFIRLLIDLLPPPFHLLPLTSSHSPPLPPSPPPSPFSPISRALSHVLGIVNETPASSSKYQFVMGMAERIVEENVESGEEELLQINKAALSSAFTRTSTLLYNALARQERWRREEGGGGGWALRMVKWVPFGSYILQCWVNNMGEEWVNGEEEEAEKYAEELLWITGKMKRGGGEVGEAVERWSKERGLAGLAGRAEGRVQGVMVKITVGLVREMGGKGEGVGVGEGVKVRMMVVWMPVLCHGRNGLGGCTVLSGFEKGEVERVMREIVDGLDLCLQETVLSCWIQEYALSSSDWLNLLPSFHRWCHSSRSIISSLC